jgi:hypothetical protein
MGRKETGMPFREGYDGVHEATKLAWLLARMIIAAHDKGMHVEAIKAALAADPGK